MKFTLKTVKYYILMYLSVECRRTTNTTNLIGDDEERVDEDQVMCLYREEAALLEREQNRSQQGDFGRAAHTHTKVKG